MPRNFYLALIGVSIGGVGFGLITPVTVLLSEQNNVSSYVNGLLTFSNCLGVFLFSKFAGRLIDRYNVKKILLTGLFIWMLGAYGHIFWYDYLLLFPIKFFMGIGGTFVFVSTEVMINYYSNETNRGKNIGLYVVLLSVGIAVGTLLIWTIEIANWIPFVIGGSIMLTVLVIQSLFMEELKISQSDRLPDKMPINKMPLISLLAAAFYGLLESSIVVALPLYGLRNGFTSNEVSFMLASFVVGGIVLLYIIGSVSDKYDRYKLLLAISLILGFMFLIPALIIRFDLLLVIFFLIGGIVPAFYTIGLNYTVEKVDKEFMAQANGYYLMMYGAGTLAGPIAGSFLIEADKRLGYWFAVSLLSVLFFLVFHVNNRK